MPNQVIQLPSGSFEVTILTKDDFHDFPQYSTVYFVKKNMPAVNGEEPIVCLKNNIDDSQLIFAFTAPELVINFFDFFQNGPARQRFTTQTLPLVEIDLTEFFDTASANQSILIDPPKEMQVPYSG